MSRRGKGLVWGWVVLAAAAGCRNIAPPDHVLLVTLDTLRADHVGLDRPARAETPHLRDLARRGVSFREAYAEVPITLPSHVSIFFGLSPHLVGNYNNGQTFPPPDVPSLAEKFKAAGYATAAFVSLGVLEKRFGLDRGFDVYEDGFPENRWYLDAAELNGRVLPWLEKAAAGKFFAWVHYSDPHDPYAPPDTPDDLNLTLNGRETGRCSLAKFRTIDIPLALSPGENILVWNVENAFPDKPGSFLARFDRFEILSESAGRWDFSLDSGWEVRPADGVHYAKDGARIIFRTKDPRTVRLRFRGRPIWSVAGVRAMYRREVEFLDRELGRLWAKLDDLGLRETTFILAAGDHGEGLGEFVDAYGEAHIGHIHHLYSYYLHVPLIIVDPRAKQRGVVRDDPAELLDIVPTLARRFGFQAKPKPPGRNLLGRPGPPDRDLFAETYRPEAAHEKFSLRRFPWQLILTPEEGKLELYDLREDPDEFRNLFGQAERTREARPLQPILEDRARDILNGKTEIKIDKRAEDMLRALGYVK
jgi:arylsulfatase A-like enzyme